MTTNLIEIIKHTLNSFEYDEKELQIMQHELANPTLELTNEIIALLKAFVQYRIKEKKIQINEEKSRNFVEFLVGRD